jgi:hypothetical protein
MKRCKPPRKPLIGVGEISQMLREGKEIKEIKKAAMGINHA